MEHGDQHIGFGIMGGMNQPLAHAQFVSNIVDYHMNIQAAMEEARFTVSAKLGCNILIESRVGPDAITQLTAMGHKLHVRKEYSVTMGRGQAVLHDSTTGMNYGASEPRADGAAVLSWLFSPALTLTKMKEGRPGSPRRTWGTCPLRTYQIAQRFAGAIGWPVLQANAL